LHLARKGLGDKQIATEIGISTDTVRTYWQRIRKKVGGQNRAEIVATLSDKIAAQTLEAVNTEKETLLREILRRTAVEKALRTSEREWRLLADSMPQIVFVANPDGRIFHYNARFYEYTGLSQERALGFGWNTVIHADDLPNVGVELERCLPAGIPFEYEMRIRREDGEYRWHVNRAIPQRDERGKITRWYGTSTDIHESRILRDRLQDSATFLSQAQRIARLGSYEFDVSRNVGRWSDNLFEIFGLKPREGWFDSDEFMSMIHPDDLPSVEQAVRESIDSGTGFSEYYRCLGPDGQVIRVHSVAKPVIEAGAVVRLIGTIQDITSRRTIEITRDRLQEIFDSTPDMIRLVNVRGELILCNRAALDFFGAASLEELRQRDFQKSYPEWASTQTLEVGIPAAHLQGSWQGETVLIDSEGREARASQVILALPDRDTDSYLFTLICRTLK